VDLAASDLATDSSATTGVSAASAVAVATGDEHVGS
jgi:hypothetical protein